jgi:hypothetical protein
MPKLEHVRDARGAVGGGATKGQSQQRPIAIKDLMAWEMIIP